MLHSSFINTYSTLTNTLHRILLPITLLISRYVVAMAFFKAGLVKISSWESTLFLFEYEYSVPLLPWLWAAYIGTAVELIVPVFLLLGLVTRPFALLLFVFNIMAVISYPVIWQQGFYDHQLWGLMLLLLVIHGAGKVSIDYWLSKKLI